jgi:mRNA-degrading endonuclease toxin of MazEF toxin-antitoxin module
MAFRSTKIVVHNETAVPLRYVGSSVEHGQWTDPIRPPAVIPPGEALWWQTESADLSVGTGTEGHATYRIGDPTWEPWFPVNPATIFDHTTQQVVPASRGEEQLDLFVIGLDNAVWSTHWDPAGGWQPWFQIHPETVFDHRTQKLTAFSRRGDQMDLFVIGFDNAVWTTFWREDGGWRPWFQVHPETVFDHTTQRVMAASRGEDQLDLYVIGFDNAVWSTFWREDGSWRPWFQIHPETVFDHATQTVMPISRRSDQMDLYVIGFDNAVSTTHWTEDVGWRPWAQIHAETVFDHTTQTIMPISRRSDQMDLYVIGFDNAIWSTFWLEDGGWRPWFQIHPETTFDHTTQTVMPVSRQSDQVDLYVIGFDDAVWSTFWREDGGWRPWFQVQPEAKFPHGTQTVVPLSRNPNHLDLFAIGFDGAVWSSWWRSSTFGSTGKIRRWERAFTSSRCAVPMAFTSVEARATTPWSNTFSFPMRVWQCLVTCRPSTASLSRTVGRTFTSPRSRCRIPSATSRSATHRGAFAVACHSPRATTSRRDSSRPRRRPIPRAKAIRCSTTSFGGSRRASTRATRRTSSSTRTPSIPTPMTQ